MIVTPKLTKEFLRDNNVFFEPKTTEEVAFIFDRLHGMGYAGSWNPADPADLAKGLRGLIWYCGTRTLYCEPMDESKRKALFCTADDFGEDKSIKPATLQDIYNLLVAVKADLADVRARVERVEKEVIPAPIDKPKLRL